MTLVSWAAIYIVIWWLCLFLILPFGGRSQAEAGDITKGSDPGAPALLRWWPKLLATTLLAAALQVLLLWTLTNPVLREYWR